MTVKYKPSKHATHFSGESLTEQEHLQSCDINHMIASVNRGQDIRLAQSANYGLDDLTMTGLELRIAKENHERELQRISETQEFSQEELDHIPKEVRSKFDFKLKKPITTDPDPKSTPKNDELNDDKMAKTKGQTKNSDQTSVSST